jgi:hypothetical protein
LLRRDGERRSTGPPPSSLARPMAVRLRPRATLEGVPRYRTQSLGGLRPQDGRGRTFAARASRNSSHEARKAEAKIVACSIGLDNGEAERPSFSVVSRPPLKSEDRRGPSCGNWIPCAAATIACEGYFLPSCSIRYRRDASNPYLRRNPGSPSSSASVITASTAERSVRSRSAIGLESMPQRAGRPTRWCSGGPGWSGAVGCSCSCSRCAATAGASANARTASGTSSTAMPARHETSDRRALPSPGATSPRQIG